jgi:hypothetical protein
LPDAVVFTISKVALAGLSIICPPTLLISSMIRLKKCAALVTVSVSTVILSESKSLMYTLAASISSE